MDKAIPDFLIPVREISKEKQMDPIRKLDRSVKGRAVLITGAASGMGRATAHLFAAEGALVAITDINETGSRAYTMKSSPRAGTRMPGV